MKLVKNVHVVKSHHVSAHHCSAELETATCSAESQRWTTFPQRAEATAKQEGNVLLSRVVCVSQPNWSPTGLELECGEHAGRQR